MMTKNLLQQVLQERKDQADVIDFEAFTEALTAHYTDEPEEKFIKKKSFAPSTIGNNHGACARYWYYAFKGTTSFKKHHKRGLHALDQGKASHERIQTLMEKAGLLVEKETKIHLDSPPINGYLDAVVTFEDKDLVVEIKTTKQEIWLEIKQSGRALPEHLLQVLLYMYYKQIKVGFIMYENKNNGDWTYIPVKMTPQHRKYVKNVLQWLEEVYANDQLPKRQFKASTKACKYCPFRQVCREVRRDEGVVVLPQFPTL